MNEYAPHLRINVFYNHNKFFKHPLRPDETAIAAANCPICGGQMTPVLDVQTTNRTSVLTRSICEPCDFLTFSRMPNEAWFETFYRSDWDRNRSEDSIQTKIEAPYEPLFEVLLPHITPEMRVLDIGAGYGGALNRLRREGFNNIRGIEASQRRWRVCRDQLNLNVTLTTAEKMESEFEIASGAPYDVVFSWHVVEHVVDLNQSLAAIAKLLRPGGKLVIGVPHRNHEHLIYLAHFLPHVHSFTPRSLELLLARHGFVVEHVDDMIRVVAQRVEDPSVASAQTPRSKLSESLQSQMEHDLNLAVLSAANETPLMLEYDMTMFRNCTSHSQTTSKMSLCGRLNFAAKHFGIGPGHNIRPILHPTIRIGNALDPRNALHWIALHTLSFSSRMEFGGSIQRLESQSKTAPRIDIVYPGTSSYGWIK